MSKNKCDPQLQVHPVNVQLAIPTQEVFSTLAGTTSSGNRQVHLHSHALLYYGT